MNRIIRCACFVITAFASIGVAQENRYVSTSGTHQPPFTNWLTAAQDIKTAVDWANTNNAGDTVWVANGIYAVPITVVVSNTIVRGFSGNPADVVVNGGGVTQCFILNHPNAVLADMTVSNGRNANATLFFGGALTINTGKSVNAVIGWSSAAGRGGGVLLRGNPENRESALLDRCVVISNRCSQYGAGVYFHGGGTVRDCTIISNWVTGSNPGRGGGIGVYNSATNATVIDCLIQFNSARQYGGGIYLNDSGVGTSLIWNCMIEYCISEGRGGGIYVGNFGLPSVDICSSIIRANTSLAEGGGMAVSVGNIRNCLIISNQASLTDSGGGGLYGSDRFSLANCTIAANTAFRGSGIYSQNTNALYYNCIVYGNVNMSTGYTNEIDVTFNAAQFFYCCAARTLSLPQNNIVQDPLWVNPAIGDYRLPKNSPCVNTGTNLTGMTEMTDVAGHLRLDRFSGKVDMGAYEYVPEGFLFLGR